jgi:hypothetical protein
MGGAVLTQGGFARPHCSVSALPSHAFTALLPYSAFNAPHNFKPLAPTKRALLCRTPQIGTFSFETGSYLMAKKASKRRAWTSVQVRELKTLAKKKTPAARIARTLKRTEGATRQKAFSMGLSLDSRA